MKFDANEKFVECFFSSFLYWLLCCCLRWCVCLYDVFLATYSSSDDDDTVR